MQRTTSCSAITSRSGEERKSLAPPAPARRWIKMGRKKPTKDREFLEFKLQILNDYISHREHMVQNFNIDVEKASILFSPQDFSGVVVHIKNAVGKLWAADRSTDLIKTDLAHAHARFNT